MLHEDVETIVGDVVAIDPDRKTVKVVTTAGPRVERYHKLIYAVGSIAAAGVPGARDFAFLLANPDGALAARHTIAAMQPGARIIGRRRRPHGVEAAAEIAERHAGAAVTMLCGGLLTFMAAGRTRISLALARLGVEVRENVRVARVREHSVELADGTQMLGGATVWAAAFAVPRLAADSGLAVDEIGRLRVDEYLRRVDHPDIVGAGDAVTAPPRSAPTCG